MHFLCGLLLYGDSGGGSGGATNSTTPCSPPHNDDHNIGCCNVLLLFISVWQIPLFYFILFLLVSFASSDPSHQFRYYIRLVRNADVLARHWWWWHGLGKRFVTAAGVGLLLLLLLLRPLFVTHIVIIIVLCSVVAVPFFICFVFLVRVCCVCHINPDVAASIFSYSYISFLLHRSHTFHG